MTITPIQEKKKLKRAGLPIPEPLRLRVNAYARKMRKQRKARKAQHKVFIAKDIQYFSINITIPGYWRVK